MIAFAWIIFFSFSVMSFSLLPKIKSKIISINNIILKEKMNEADKEKRDQIWNNPSHQIILLCNSLAQMDPPLSFLL
jgi:hypothetical protein